MDVKSWDDAEGVQIAEREAEEEFENPTVLGPDPDFNPELFERRNVL